MRYALRILIMMIGVAATGCDGILDGMYDNPPAVTQEDMGFNGDDELTIDATSYTSWVYISLRNRTTDTRLMTDPEPQEWDIAVHRYDARTNGGEAAELPCNELQQVKPAMIAEARWEKDSFTTDRLMTDLSGMLTGDIKYADGWCNLTLSRWLNLDLSVMPPIYTPSNKVYLVRLGDGTLAAVRLKAYKSAKGRKGIMTIQYAYPL